VNIIVFIAVGAVIVVGAVALGMKFFNTSVHEQEDERGWEE
jgi:hypothetical protein